MALRLKSVLLLALLAPSTAGAQAILKGSVRQDSSGIPLQDVEVIAEAARKHVASDKNGRFLLRGLPYGPQTILFRRIGFRPVSRGVLLLKGDTARMDVLMINEAAARLEPIAVEAPRERPPPMGVREGFEARRQLGFGKFIDSTFLRANEHRRVSDVLRSVSGIELYRGRACTGSGVCGPFGFYARGTRGNPVRFIRTGQTISCWASIIVDGVVLYQDGASIRPPPELSSEIMVSELDAVEVYRSAAEYPQEFSGTIGSCGLVVFWTRHGR